MDRTHYTFDKRLRYCREGRLRLVICAAQDCRTAMHLETKQGRGRRIWCSDRCRCRERQRRIKRIPPSKHWPKKRRHKGVLGTQHWRF